MRLLVLDYADSLSPGTSSLAGPMLLRQLNDLFGTAHANLGWSAWDEWELIAAPALLDREDKRFDLDLWRRAMGLDGHGGQQKAAQLLGVRRERLYLIEAGERPMPPDLRRRAMALLQAAAR